MMDTENATQVESEAVETVETVEATESPKVTKSIVPARYAGRYKAGGSDELAEFIKKQATGKEGFEWPAFFQLVRANGILEEKVAHYEAQVAAKRHGAEGRARMTLRNMLATIARKNGKLVGLNGEETTINLPKPVLSGAAADAATKAGAAEGTAPAEGAATSQF